MPLVACPDCGQQLSDAAPACLKCGRPMRAPLAGLGPSDVQTVELTSKRWKKLQLWGGVFMVLAPIVCATGMGGGSSHPSVGTMATGWGMFLLGLVLMLWGRLGAFWYHK